MNTEPSRLLALITAAVTATVGLLALLFSWPEEVVAGLVIVLGAWIAVLGEIVRSKVTPTDQVKLTVAEHQALLAAGYSAGKRKLNPDGDLDAR